MEFCLSSLTPKEWADTYDFSHGNTLGDVGRRAVRTSTPVSVTYNTPYLLEQWNKVNEESKIP